MYRCLFVAYQNVFYLLLLEYFVIQGQDRATRVTEHEFDAFFLKTSHRDLGTGQLGDNAGSQFHGNTRKSAKLRILLRKLCKIPTSGMSVKKSAPRPCGTP